MRYFPLAFLITTSLFCLPKGLHVVQGEVCAQGTESHLQIQAADRAILHWQEFSIASSEKVQFIQPSSASAVLNRVQGEHPSQILGQLCANGQVYLINPHGVLFGKDATILVSNLFVSTLNCSDASFSLGDELLFEGDSRETIVNYGTITALDGNIALLGRLIENQGVLTAPHGEVILAAGQEILIRPEGAPIVTIRPKQDKDGLLTHTGTIEALAVELQAEGQAYSYGINMEGTVLALNPVNEGGRIYLRSEGVSLSPSSQLKAPQGRIEIATGEKGLYAEGSILAQGGSLIVHQEPSGPPSFQMGTIDVSGLSGGSISMDVAALINHGRMAAEGTLERGGSISIRAEGSYIETSRGHLSVDGVSCGGKLLIQSYLSLFSSGKFSSQGSEGGDISLDAPTLTLVSADLDASGTHNGGSIQIGASSNTHKVHLGGNTHLCVSSTEHGDGGKILVLSEERTTCYGSIEARGGSLGGDGGKIEVSGKQELGCYATLSASAPKGKGGLVFFDPKNIVIDSVTGVYPQYALIDPSILGTGFGTAVAVLSTGKIVVTKPSDSTAAASAGAVYLYDGLTAALVSTLLGSTASDQIGSSGVTTLTGNGNYVIRSPNWDSGAVTNVGAATWGSGETGVSGSVSSSNSFVGSQTSDQVSNGSVTALTNGNYVVRSSSWDNGVITDAGAITWGNGSTGGTGVVSSSNSLVGTTNSDNLGSSGIVILTNGNYVVCSSGWDQTAPATVNVGAATWGNGTTGTTGTVSSSNSLIGSTASDSVSSLGAVALTNGNYVVVSPNWDQTAPVTVNVGAVTWGNGSTGVTGIVSSSNSLIGSTAADGVGGSGVTALTNGNYVVSSPSWDDGAVSGVGAATWGNGTTGTTGVVSSSNSLVGSTAGDAVSVAGITALTNGNYVVQSTTWDNGALSNAGAATWGDGSTGISGAVSSSNSLVGSTANDNVGSSIAVLTNGNYVVISQAWDQTAPVTLNVGAATWGDGTTGVTGLISSSNSLIGSTASDSVGSPGITVLTNGNYVVRSSNWDQTAPLTANVGAATWGNGTTGTTGIVSSSNSLVGSTANDNVSNTGVTALTNGNYVVISASWDQTVPVTSNVGAATWGDGTTGITGVISSSNSLIGSTASDTVGSSGVTALTNGNYVVRSPNWDSGAATNVGAATWGNGSTGTSGVVSSSNSVVGSTTNDNVSTTGVTALANGNYIVLSANWDNGATANAGAATWGDGTVGISGTVSVQNSIAGPIASSALQSTALDDTVNGTFVVRFTGGVGYVLIGLQDPNQMTFARAEAQTMTIPPAFITDALDEGTSVTVQANNDFTLSSAFTTSGSGDFTVQAGRSVAINANITMANGSLTVVANDLLSSGVVDAYRDAGDATFTIANGVTINTGTGDLSLSLLNGAGKTYSSSGDFTIGDSVTLTCSGSGAMTILAEQNNIVLGSNDLFQTVDGNLKMTAGVNISASGSMTIQTTGIGQLTLIVDNLFPAAPLFGNGSALFPGATLATGGGKLLIYTSQRNLNAVPSVINGHPYIPGPEPFDSVTEKWGIYYPSSSGIPFTIFYKTPGPLAPSFPSAAHSQYAAIVAPFQDWLNFWNKDGYLGVDPFPPYLTPKGFFLRQIPSLAFIEELLPERKEIRRGSSERRGAQYSKKK